MYTRDFGGIQSDGQLYNYEREYNNREREYNEPQKESVPSFQEENIQTCQLTEKPRHNSPKGLSFLRNLKLDDLLLIGIGLILLLDSEEENDIFSLLIAILLMF